MIEDLLPSISWSLIGFVAGWLVGREMLFISQIREVVVPKAERERTDHTLPKVTGNRLLGWIVIILALFTVAQGSYYAYDRNQITQCQAKFNADFAATVAKRAQWADEDKQAELKLWRDFLASKKPGENRLILQHYLDTTARTDKLRQENPLPKLEDRNCQ